MPWPLNPMEWASLALLILISAFYKVTWSLRQCDFAAVVMGSAPQPTEELTPGQVQAFTWRTRGKCVRGLIRHCN